VVLRREPQFLAACACLPRAHPPAMSTRSREYLFGTSIRHAAERATQVRKEADKLARDAWNKRMLGYADPEKDPARNYPTSSSLSGCSLEDRL
jgi:hypothetical protein